VVHLDHGNGFTTLYAHCNRLLRESGAGSKGEATGELCLATRDSPQGPTYTSRSRDMGALWTPCGCCPRATCTDWCPGDRVCHNVLFSSLLAVLFAIYYAFPVPHGAS